MRKFILSSFLIAVTFFACSKSDSTKLQKGTPEYELAKTLAEKVPSLDPDKNSVIVSTNEFTITSGTIIRDIQTKSPHGADRLKNMAPERLKKTIENAAKNMAEQKLLLNAAAKANIKVTPAQVDSILEVQYKRFGGAEKYQQMLTKNGVSMDFIREDIKNFLTVQHYLNKVLAEKIKITDEEIKKVYNEDKTASVRHILMMTQGKSDSEKKEIRKKMEGILQRARNGEDFAELAKKYSEDPGSKNNGGLYENFERGQMVKPFEDAAFSVPIGEISDIVETRYGYHILKIVDRKKETQPLEKVRSNIENKLRAERRNSAYKELLTQLKDQANFSIVTL